MRALLTILAVAALASACSSAEEAKTVSDQYPYMCAGALRDAQLVELPEGVVAQCESVKVTQKDLDARIAELTGSSRDQARKYPMHALEQLLTKRLMMIEARNWAKANGQTVGSEDELVRAYIAASIPKFDVTDVEAEDFSKEHASMFGGLAYEKIKDSVTYVVRDEKTALAEDEFSASAGRRHKILVSEPWFRAAHERWAKNPVEQARLSGKPTYVNFGVIGCCDKMSPVTQALRLRFRRGEINVVFVNVGEEQVLSNLYGIRTIPVQFLFDKDGRLLLRHQGNITQEQVVAKFAEIGIDLSKGGSDE